MEALNKGEWNAYQTRFSGIRRGALFVAYQLNCSRYDL